jgi:hypothetical protein
MLFHRSIWVSTTILTLICLILAPAAHTANGDAEEFGIKEQPEHKETVLDLIFGSAPEMPTERGILVIDAFEDLDRNGVKGSEEPELRNEIICQIDKIDYKVPAFIPGLDYNNRYEVRCSGKNYYPTLPDKEILIEHRGHVIEISLPCRKSDGSPSPKN